VGEKPDLDVSVLLGYKFAAIPEWVLYHPDLTAEDVRVFGVLARYGNDIRPSRQTIADAIRKSPDTVDRCISRLRKVGAIMVERRYEGDTRLPNRYYLAGDTPAAGSRTVAATPSRTDAATPAAPLRQEREQDNESKNNESASHVERRNPAFDALVEACGYDYDEMTKRQRTACAVAAAELVKVDATPDEIHWRATVFRAKHPDAACTPNALANQWAALKTMPTPRGKQGLMDRARQRAALRAVES